MQTQTQSKTQSQSQSQCQIESNPTNCIICYDDFDESNKLQYYPNTETNTITDFPYCIGCVNYEIENKWSLYIESLKKVDCEAALKRIIEKGPITWYSIPEINDGKAIKKFKLNNTEFSGVLKDLPPTEIIEQLNDRLTKLLPILSGMNTTNNITNSISAESTESVAESTESTESAAENDYDYMSRLNNILTELNL
jgi:hypothetical protein